VPGGSARATLDTIAALEARGEVEQIGVSAWHRQPAPAEWQPVIDVRALPLSRLALYDAWQRLRRPVVERATGAVDVVHATAHVASASKAPMVATVHDLHFLHEPSHFTARGISVFSRFLAIVRDEAAVVVCPSQATRADCVAAGIDAARVRVTPWGTAMEPVGETEVARVRSVHDLRRPFVLFAGTVEPRKNLARLLEAYRRLGDVEAELVLVGPDGWGPDLPDEGVRRLGFVPTADLHALYAAAAVEPFAQLLAETLAGSGAQVVVLPLSAEPAPRALRGATVVGLPAGPAAVLAGLAADELDALDDDLVLRPLPAAVLVVPLVELQPALDVQ